MKPSSVLTTHGFCPSPSPYFGGTFFFSANIRGEFATLNILMEDFTRANEPTIRTHDNLRGTWHISVIKNPFYPKKNRICLNIQCSYLYQPIHEIWLTKVPQHTPTFSLYHLPFCFIFFFFFFSFHVFGVKRAGFNTPGRHCFLNFLDSFNCSRIFLVLEMYCKKATFSAFLWTCSWILNFWQTCHKDSEKSGKS